MSTESEFIEQTIASLARMEANINAICFILQKNGLLNAEAFIWAKERFFQKMKNDQPELYKSINGDDILKALREESE